MTVHRRAFLARAAAAAVPLTALTTGEVLGAVADGLHDDQPALQRALNSIAEKMAGFGPAKLDLGGRKYLVGLPLKVPPCRGLIVENGAIVASGSFPRDGFILDTTRSATIAGGWNLQNFTLSKVTLDANHRAGCLRLMGHNGTYVDPSCSFIRYATKGLLSQNGAASLSNEMVISGRFFEYMPQLDEKTPYIVTGDAIDIQHNDACLAQVVIGPSANGVKISGQYCFLHQVHSYPAYLTHSAASRALWLSRSSAHVTCGAGCYFDQSRVVLETSSVRFFGCEFLASTNNPAFKFIEFELEKDVGVAGFSLVGCGFHNTGDTIIETPIAVTTGSMSANLSDYFSCQLEGNLFQNVKAVTLESLVDGIGRYDGGAVKGQFTFSYRKHEQLSLTLVGDVSSLTIEDLPNGKSLDITIRQDEIGNRMLTFGRVNGSSVRWFGGTHPRLSASAGKIQHVRLTNVGYAILGDVKGHDA